MKKTVCIAVCLFFFFVLAVEADEVRTWTSGSFKVEAEFVGLSDDGTTVTLLKTDGKKLDVPLEKLSKEDQEYVAGNTKSKTDPPKTDPPKTDAPKKDAPKKDLPKKDGPLQPPTGKWASGQYQSMLTRSKNITDQSESLLKLEADKGAAGALVRLGLYYFAKKRETEAMDCWRRAADQDMQAASYLGVLCFAKADYKEAGEWIQKVADNGNAGAKEFLKEITAAETGRPLEVEKKDDSSPSGTSSGAAPRSESVAPSAMPKNIVTRQDCINAILSKITDGADRGIVLKFLKICDYIEYDKVNRFISCNKSIPSGYTLSRTSSVQPRMSVYPFEGDGEMWGGLGFNTCDNSAIFPDSIQVADKNGKIWRSPAKKWTHDINVSGGVWVLETTIYGFPNHFSDQETDAVMNAIIKNNGCIIRISGSKGYRDIEITGAKAQECQLYYDAYKVLKKYYEETE